MLLKYSNGVIRADKNYFQALASFLLCLQWLRLLIIQTGNSETLVGNCCDSRHSFIYARFANNGPLFKNKRTCYGRGSLVSYSLQIRGPCIIIDF